MIQMMLATRVPTMPMMMLITVMIRTKIKMRIKMKIIAMTRTMQVLIAMKKMIRMTMRTV